MMTFSNTTIDSGCVTTFKKDESFLNVIHFSSQSTKNLHVNPYVNFSRNIERSSNATLFQLSKCELTSKAASDLNSDFDIFVPLKPGKKFKIKATIKSIKKFRPQPFFD